MSLLAVEGLTKAFGGVRAVDDVSFAVAPGTIFSIIGPNGAGKTTLFNLVTGIYRPSEGRVRLDGRDITGWTAHRLAALGLSRTFQNPQVFFNMTALENVMVGLHVHSDCRLLPALLRGRGMAGRERACRAEAAAMLDRVGLGAWREAEADALPYGALKRLEIARALASRPRLLLLDEPAAGLNPTETQEIDRLIKSIAESGVTVVLVEHNMPLVMGISDRILVLESGRRLAEGSAEAVGRNPDVIAAYLGGHGGAAQRAAGA
jgi:branched-chain amino acid transport system ATP-binding protein